MNHAGSQQRSLLDLLAKLRPHWRRDAGLAARLEQLLRADRRFGSRDRRLYRELLYTALRYLPWIEPHLDTAPDRAATLIAWLAAETPATRPFRAALLADWPACPAASAEKAALLTARLGTPHDADDLLPAWLREEAPDAFIPAQRNILLARAPLWLRLLDREAVHTEFTGLGWPWQPSAQLPNALNLPPDLDVTKTESFARGRVEIQDIGSQMILASIGVEPGTRWLDACAGAGGKTLQLASLLGPTGHVVAHDIRPAALDELSARAHRAGLTARTLTITRQPAGLFDGVLVDAPCSGSGTWRRAPHLKWTTTPDTIRTYAAQQRMLLANFATRVRPGGRLVYATCSLCHSENEDIVRDFLAAHPDFAPAPFAQPFFGEPRGAGLLFWPVAHDGDGFFVASLRRVA